MPGKNTSKIVTLMLTLFVLGMIAIGQAGADLPAPPTLPDLPPAATPTPSTSGGSSGGSGSHPVTVIMPSAPSPTATPTPTPVPANDLEVTIPDSVTVNSVTLSIRDNVVYAPGGTVLLDVIKHDTFDVVIPSNDNSTSRLTITVASINASAASLRSVRLTAQKTLELNGEKADLLLKASIGGWPAGGRLDAMLVDPTPIDVKSINDQLGAYVNVSYEPDPIAVVDVQKSGLENGKDIFDCDLVLALQRPDNVDVNTTYGALRQNDGMCELLNATLLSGPDSGSMVFEINSPGGFSEFTLVRTRAAAPPIAAEDEAPVLPEEAPAAQAGTTWFNPGMIFLLITNLAALAVIGFLLVKKSGR